MINYLRLENYTENNRIEAKRALGGFPNSVWETYSAFANTMGGVILLGVEERRDRSFHAVNLPNPEDYVAEFWHTVRDKSKVSAVVLEKENVAVKLFEGKRFLAITVPRARRSDRPVYVGTNPYTGTYRRSGEGDYRCNAEEVAAMMRDAEHRSKDEEPLIDLTLSALNKESVRRYRAAYLQKRGRKARAASERKEAAANGAFLLKIGAAKRERPRMLRPTAAGLLFFGKAEAIARAFPSYALTLSVCGEERPFSGNLWEFYLAAEEAICSCFSRCGEKAIGALKEALLNCLVNADYRAGEGVFVSLEEGKAVFSNPGSFRIDLEQARSGGLSDPRNGALAQLFRLIGAGSGNGGGIPKIYAVWKERGFAPPVLSEEFQPDRITVTLPLTAAKENLSFGGKTVQKAAVVDFLTEHITADLGALSALLGVEKEALSVLLGELKAEGVVTETEENSAKNYRLKR